MRTRARVAWIGAGILAVYVGVVVATMALSEQRVRPLFEGFLNAAQTSPAR